MSHQHVVPHPKGWAVKRSKGAKPSSVHKTQAEAIAKAKAVARNQGSTVYVHRPDGRIRAIKTRKGK